MNLKKMTSKRTSVNSSTSLLHNQRVFETILLTESNKLHVYPAKENLKPISKETDDLFTYFRGLLILGRILGVVPISGVTGKSYRQLQSSLLSLSGIVSLSCIILLAFNTAFAIIRAVALEKRSILAIAKIIGNPLFGSYGLFIYVYFLTRRHQLLKIFKAWSKCCQSLTYTKKDLYLYRTIVLISVIMFSSTVIENGILHLEFFRYFDDINGHTKRYGKDNSNVSIAKMYYWRSHDYWYQAVGYHPILVPVVFLVHKWALYGWNYMEIFSALMFRALYFKFKALYESAHERLIEPMPLEISDVYMASEEDQQAWNKLAKDHDSLCQVMNVMNKFFSPLLFVSYAVNIYFFCNQLLMGLNPEDVQNSLVHSIYAPWSFVHIIARVFILSFFGAKVNEYAHKIREVVIRCPVELFSGHVAKLEKLVNGGQKLGFSGLGCFVITMPFMLSILNVVFTIEIVLLQGLAADSSSTTKGC